ncbi:MAG: hypothetical protein ABSF92_05910 [Candidatus Acidiferrales bacterium]
MRKPLVLVCAMLGLAAGAVAQESGGTGALTLTSAASPDTPAMSAAPAAPEPSPMWRFGLREEKSWQLSMGYTYVRFRSAPLTTNLNGVNTMLAKYFSDWLGVEGEVTAAFGGVIPGGRAKYLFYGGGPRIAARNMWRLEPWVHAVAGGVYVQPQVAGVSRSGFGLEAGGGVDLRWRPRMAIRLEGDWTRSRVYGGNQNNFQAVTGLVFNF